MASVVFTSIAAAGLWMCPAGEPARSAPDQPPAPAAVRPGAVKVLAIEQEVRGLPDRPDEVVVQTILLDAGGNRLALIEKGGPGGAKPGPAAGKPDDPAAKTAGPAAALGGTPSPGAVAGPAASEGDRRIILDLGPRVPEITEIWDSQKAYRKTTRDLNRLQETRNENEANILNHLGEYSAAERKDVLEQTHLRPDGKRIVEVADIPAGGKKLLGHECRQVKVIENGRTVIDAKVTKDFPGAKSFFNLYRKLGAFSPEVLDRVSKIDGFPLEAEITVVTGLTGAYRIAARCLSVKEEEVPDSRFQVPAGYQERIEAPAIVTCDNGCGKEVEPKETKWVIARPPDTYYFCSQKCLDEFKEKIKQKGWEGWKKEREEREKAKR